MHRAPAIDFAFETFSTSHITVTIIASDDTRTALGSNQFSVVLTNELRPKSIGRVTLIGPEVWLDADDNLVSGYSVEVRRRTPLTQVTRFREIGTFSPSTLENALDKLTMIFQEQKIDIEEAS